MKNLGAHKNLAKDATMLIVLALLLVSLPIIRDMLQPPNDTGSVEVEQEAVVDTARIEQELAFIEEVFPKVSAWEVEELTPYLSDSTKTENWNSDIDSVLNTLSLRLGELERYDAPEPVPASETPLNAQEARLTAYEFIAFYEAGVADINLVIADNNGSSLLHSFNIDVHDTAAGFL